MRLTKKALTAINKQDIRLKLALTLNCTEQWIIKMIKANKDNGLLTTASALAVIRQEAKMKDDQILTKESVAA